ncbi:MAG: hypothetical protein HRF40_03735 [Nitrososphaera sp.]|jgi:hypothetical protein
MIEPDGDVWDTICRLYPDAPLQERLVMYEVYWADSDGCPYYFEVVERILLSWSPILDGRRQVHDLICKLVDEGTIRCRFSPISEMHYDYESGLFQPWIVLLTNLELKAALARNRTTVEGGAMD